MPAEALRLSPQALAERRASMRRFDTPDETRVLAAVAGLLQDLGFTIDAGESRLGLIVASKQRSARDGGQVVGQIFATVLLRKHVAIDEAQKLRASVVTNPVPGGVAVRVTFQRIVWDDRGNVSRRERLADPRDYQEFFDKLSKAVFLEAHAI